MSFSTASNCWSRLFGCFKNIRAWQFALLHKHLHFTVFKWPLAQNLCEPGMASRRITPIELRKSSNSVIAACDLLAASQQYTLMEIQSSTQDNKSCCQQWLTLHPCRSSLLIATTPSTWTCMHNFFTNLKPYLRPADKNIVVFSSPFMHYHLDMRLLQGNHNMFCDIHIFYATTTAAEALLFSIQELTIVECSGDVQLTCCVVFLCKQNIALLFRAKTKFCVFFRGTMCVIIFFLPQLVQRKYLWRFYVSQRNSAVNFSQVEPTLSYLATGKAQLNACAFSDGVEKQKCCLGPGDIKTVITFFTTMS